MIFYLNILESLKIFLNYNIEEYLKIIITMKINKRAQFRIIIFSSYHY